MARYPDREHAIRLRKRELVRMLLQEPGCPDAVHEEHFRQFCQLLEAIFHFEFHKHLERIKELYAPFDPDIAVVYPISEPENPSTSRTDDRPNVNRNLNTAPAVSAGASLDQQDTVESGVGNESGENVSDLPPRLAASWPLLNAVRLLLERANFVRLSRSDLEQAMQQAGRWGLHFEVNFDLFETLELYARGDTVEKEKIPARLFGLIGEREVEVPVYERLLLIVRFREDARVPPFVDKDCIYIKLFKDVPKADLEMLVPGTEPRIRPLDGFKIGMPLFLGVLMCLWKLVMGAALTLASGVAGILAWMGIIGAPISYGVRSYFGYVSTRQKYQLTVTQCLFFQNLDNNLGAIMHLIDEAEEQEFRETVLSWFFLWRLAGDEGWIAEQLDDAIEQYLERRANLAVDFEIEDALAKLQRFDLAKADEQGRWRAIPLLAACARLDEIWDNYFRYNRKLWDS